MHELNKFSSSGAFCKTSGVFAKCHVLLISEGNETYNL